MAGAVSAEKSEKAGDGLVEKVVAVKRISKVVKGGRIFSFSAMVVVGNPEENKIGYGFGKAREVPEAMRKAKDVARKNMRYIDLNGDTIWYEKIARFGATRVFMKPASEGTGIIAGGAMRPVFEVLGVRNVLSKVQGGGNPINVVKATIKGLTETDSPEHYAMKRGMKLSDILDIKTKE